MTIIMCVLCIYYAGLMSGAGGAVAPGTRAHGYSYDCNLLTIERACARSPTITKCDVGADGVVVVVVVHSLQAVCLCVVCCVHVYAGAYAVAYDNLDGEVGGCVAAWRGYELIFYVMSGTFRNTRYTRFYKYAYGHKKNARHRGMTRRCFQRCTIE